MLRDAVCNASGTREIEVLYIDQLNGYVTTVPEERLVQPSQQSPPDQAGGSAGKGGEHCHMSPSKLPVHSGRSRSSGSSDPHSHSNTLTADSVTWLVLPVRESASA